MTRIVLICCVFLAATRAAAQSVFLTNTMDEPIYLYVWKDDTKSWEYTYFARDDRKPISCRKAGKYYMVIRDSLNRDLKLGRVDLHNLTQPELAIDVLYQNKGKAEIVSVGPGVFAYRWRPTTRRHYAMEVKLVPYVLGQSVVVLDDELQVDPTTGDAVRNERYTAELLTAP